MIRYSANLTLLWPELPVLDRFRAASRSGFRRVEILFVHDLDLDEVGRLLRDLRLELVLFDPRPGDWAKGDRGTLSLPGREAEFAAGVREAIANAARFGTRRLNCLAGIQADRARGFETATANLKAAAPLAAAAGLTLLVEAINNVDMPGYFLRDPEDAAALVHAVDSPSVRLQLDQYHAGMAGQDARESLRRHRPIIEHVQIADVPGRHQPGTGTQPIAQFLQELDGGGYTGCVGLEYKPLGPTDESLAWLPPDLRG